MLTKLSLNTSRLLSRDQGLAARICRLKRKSGTFHMTLVEQYRTRSSEQAASLRTPISKTPISKWVAIGWLIAFAGSILWFYGYHSIGSVPLIDWYSMVPFWIAHFFRNIECEAGAALGIAGAALISWPHLR